MSVLAFHEAPPADLASALAEFERQFNYPLGPGRSFRIEHGADYARFYRAQGEARCFVRVEAGRVLGVLCAALRPLLLPDGEVKRVAYIGDLKVAPEARAGMTLYLLGKAAIRWLAPQTDSAFGVVMDGTLAVPASYTGRAGIPAFARVGQVMIYRLTTHAGAKRQAASEVDVRDCFAELGHGRFACPSGRPEERSLTSPVWLMLPDGSACGCLEDTRNDKRLIANDGQEMLSAHLSCFAFRDAASGVRLIEMALTQAAALGYPALFVAVDIDDAAAFDALLPAGAEVVRATATVFGHNLPAGRWLIPTSEI
jgi:hypothetical protein